jgi:hypothetical protein
MYRTDTHQKIESGSTRTTTLIAGIALAAIVALFAFPSLASASGHRHMHHPVGKPARVRIAPISPEIVSNTCTLPTFNPTLYLQTCQETEAIGPPNAASSSSPESSPTQANCSQPVANPWLYAENCLADSATGSETSLASAGSGSSNSTAAPTPDATGDTQTTIGDLGSSSCAIDPNNPWQYPRAAC